MKMCGEELLELMKGWSSSSQIDNSNDETAIMKAYPVSLSCCCCSRSQWTFWARLCFAHLFRGIILVWGRKRCPSPAYLSTAPASSGRLREWCRHHWHKWAQDHCQSWSCWSVPPPSCPLECQRSNASQRQVHQIGKNLRWLQIRKKYISDVFCMGYICRTVHEQCRLGLHQRFLTVVPDSLEYVQNIWRILSTGEDRVQKQLFEIPCCILLCWCGHPHLICKDLLM